MIGRSSAAPTRIPVEQIVRAFERRDAEELRRMVHPDAVIRPLPSPGELRGQAGVERYIEAMRARTGRVVIGEVREVSTEAVVIVGREQFLDADQQLIDEPVTWLVEFRDGLIWRTRTFASPADAMPRIGEGSVGAMESESPSEPQPSGVSLVRRRSSRLPLLLRGRSVSVTRRVVSGLAGFGCAAAVIVATHAGGEPMAWAGVTSVLAASAASISALFGGWLVGFLVGLASAGLYLPLIAYDKPPDPVLGGVPILLVWGCGGLLAGLVTDRLRGDTRDAYASVVRQRDAQRAVARTLQEALIPEALPYLDSASAAAFYRPAGDGTELGGDFYDAWLLSDTGDRFGFALGDVCGKGAPAAAITALSRHTARTASLMGADPSTILRTLNEELHGRTSSERFVTVLIGHGERRASGLHITMATGGHPLPLIRRADGSATTIGQPGTLIGIYRNPTISQFSVTLHPGDVLLLHTDGVTDLRSPDGWFGEERLHHTLRHAPPTPSGTITAIRKALTQFTPAPPQDDIALLAFGISQPLPATPRLRASTHVLPRRRPSSGTSP